MQNVYWRDRLRLILGWPLYFASYQIRHANETLFQITRAVSNWPDVLLVYLGVYGSADARFRNGMRFRAGRKELGKLVSLSELANLPESVKRGMQLRVLGDRATLRVKGRRLKLDLDVANSVAIELYTKEHSMINVRGRDVVDIGAYLDDTAIYYALSEGARHVYAFEPFPYLYRTAVRNVAANGLSKKITTYNAAVAGVSGSAGLDADFTSFGRVESSRGRTRRRGTRVVSLDSVVKRLGIRNGALKVDCEGCEYGIFSRSGSETLRSFDLIHVEYHYGYRDIVERLRSEGFSVRYTKPTYGFSGSMLKGHIVAELKR